MNNADHEKTGLTLYLLCIFILTLYCLVMAFADGIRNDTVFKHDDGFLTWEEGNPAYRSLCLLRGKVLYQDVACQYGPLPVYLRAILAGFFGNTVYLNVGWHLFWSIAAILLVFTILWRMMPWYAALAGTIFIAVPRILTTGGFTEYIGIERILLLLPILIWRPLPERSLVRSAAIASCCGMLQTVKFGSMPFLAISVFLVDIASVSSDAKKDAFSTKYLMKHFLAMILFLIIPQSIFTGWAFLSLDKTIAMDAVWPAYVKRSYSMIPPGWAGWKHLLITQLPILGNLFVGATSLILAWREKGPASRVLPAAAIGLIFYCSAAPVYFGHVFIYYQYAFMLIPMAIIGALRKASILIPLLVICNLAPFIVEQKVAWVVQRDNRLIEMALPNGERLISSATFGDDLKYLETHLVPHLSRKSNLLFVTAWGWAGGGFHAIYNPSYPLRNFLISRVSFRDYDRLELARKEADINWLLINYKGDDPPDTDLVNIDKEMSEIIGPALWLRFRARIPSDGLTRLNHFLLIKFRPEADPTM